MSKEKQKTLSQFRADDPFAADANLDLSAFPNLVDDSRPPVNTDDPFRADDGFNTIIDTGKKDMKREIIRMVNETGDSDPEIRQIIEQEGWRDHAKPQKIVLGGKVPAIVRLAGNHWKIKFVFNGVQQEFKGSTEDSVISQGLRFVSRNTGPVAKTLSADDEHFVARLAAAGRFSEAAATYISLSYPNYEGVDLTSDVRCKDTIDRAAWFIFLHGTPSYQDTPEARQFLEDYVQGRVVTVELLQVAYQAFRNRLLPPTVRKTNNPASRDEIAESFDELSDEELKDLRNASMREHAQQVRGR
jgi:hypothetical protein